MRRQLPDTHRQHGLLRVKPVLGLVEDRGLRTVDGRFGDFHAAPGRQAVHDDGVARRHGEHLVQPMAGNPRASCLPRHPWRSIHRSPGSARWRPRWRCRTSQDRRLRRGPMPSARRRIVGQAIQAEIEPCGCLDPAGGDIVAIADPGDICPSSGSCRSIIVCRSAMIWQGCERSVSALTTGTVACSARVARRENSDGDGIDITRQHARRVLDALAAPDLHVLRGQHQRRSPSWVMPTSKETRVRADGFLEDHRHRLSGKRLRTVLSRPSAAFIAAASSSMDCVSAL